MLVVLAISFFRKIFNMEFDMDILNFQTAAGGSPFTVVHVFLDSSGSRVDLTGLTPQIVLSKNGAALATKNCTVENAARGIVSADFTATESASFGAACILYHVQAGTHDDVGIVKLC